MSNVFFFLFEHCPNCKVANHGLTQFFFCLKEKGRFYSTLHAAKPHCTRAGGGMESPACKVRREVEEVTRGIFFLHFSHMFFDQLQSFLVSFFIHYRNKRRKLTSSSKEKTLKTSEDRSKMQVHCLSSIKRSHVRIWVIKFFGT